MDRRRWLAIVLAQLTLASCTLPPGPTLGLPIRAAEPVRRTVWLEPARVVEASVERRGLLERALTVELHDFLEAGRFFDDVRLLPGTPGPEDWTLRFEFASYQQGRALRMKNPVAWILTSGLVELDEFASVSFEGSLTASRRDGSVAFVARSRRTREYDVTYSAEEPAANRVRERTAFVQQLVDALLKQARRDQLLNPGGLR